MSGRDPTLWGAESCREFPGTRFAGARFVVEKPAKIRIIPVVLGRQLICLFEGGGQAVRRLMNFCKIDSGDKLSLGANEVRPQLGPAGATKIRVLQKMKVLYADDHWITRSAAKHLIDRLEPESELLEAADFRQALEIASGTPDLDLILLDLLMPGMKRFEGLRAMRECLPQVPVVVMSAIEDRDEILRCIEAGAMGYIPKSAQSDEIESALQTVLSGGVAFPRRLLEQRSPAKKAPVYGFGSEKSLEEVANALTKRQLQVYKYLGQGMSNAQVAEALGLSEHTVRVHVSAIVKRLNLDSRTQAAISAAAQVRALEEAEAAIF